VEEKENEEAQEEKEEDEVQVQVDIQGCSSVHSQLAADVPAFIVIFITFDI